MVSLPPLVPRTSVSDLTDTEKQEIRAAFDAFAGDSTSLNLGGLKVAMRALGFVPAKGEARGLLQHLGSASVDFDQFQEIMAQRIFNRRPEEEIDKAWALFDRDEDGYVSFDDIRTATAELGETLTDQEVSDIIKEADREGHGMIARADFVRVLARSGLFGVFAFSPDDEVED